MPEEKKEQAPVIVLPRFRVCGTAVNTPPPRNDEEEGT